MTRQTDVIDKVAAEHARQEAKTARQAQRHETIKSMEETIAIGFIAVGVVLVVSVVMLVVWLLNRGPDDGGQVRERNFQTCVENGGTFVPTDSQDKNKYACIMPPAP